MATNIHPLFSNDLTNFYMRSHDEAAKLVVYAALEDSFIPGSYIDAQGTPHDLFEYFNGNPVMTKDEYVPVSQSTVRGLMSYV